MFQHNNQHNTMTSIMMQVLYHELMVECYLAGEQHENVNEKNVTVMEEWMSGKVDGG